MRCPKCNSAIPIGGEMCVKCGYNVRTKQTDQNWNPPALVPPPPPSVPPVDDTIPASVPPKPKKHWFRRALVILLACLIGRYIGSMAGRLWARIELGDFSFQKALVQETVNPAFDVYLTQKGLSYSPLLKKSECFISELEAGYFEIMECGYSGDKLTESYETIYLSLEGYSASDAETLKSNAKVIFGTLLNPAYATMEESVQGNYYVLRIHYRDLDDKDVIQAMIADGFVEESSLTDGKVRYISLKKTTEAYLANGDIQR